MGLASLSQRQHLHEWMDDPAADPELLDQALRFLRRVNGLLGFTWTTLRYLDRFAKHCSSRPIRVIDLATGSADLPQAILKWADSRRLDIRVTGVDLHEHTIATARKAVPDPRLTLIRADALDLPFEANSFDYATTSLFLHHLTDEQAIRAMQEMSRVARHGVIISDLIRSRRSYLGVKLSTLLANKMVQHDAPASVAQSFTRSEITALAHQAGLDFTQYRTHFGHRFTLAGEK